MTGENILEKQREQRKEWLESLQVGDSVAVRKGSFGYSYYEILTIKKISPTRRFTLEGMEHTTFSNDGKEMGKKDTWSPRIDMEPVTEKIKESVLRRAILQRIKNTKFENLSTELLTDIYTVLEKVEPKKEV